MHSSGSATTAICRNGGDTQSRRCAHPSNQPPPSPIPAPTTRPRPNCSPMNCARLSGPPTILAAARAMKNSRNGTDSPSFSPASTFSAWRMRFGTQRTIHDHLSQSGIGRRQNRRQDPGLPQCQIAKHEARNHRPENDRQQQAGRQQSYRQALDVAQIGEVGAAGVGEQQHHQAYLCQVEEYIRVEPSLEQVRQKRKHDHPGHGKDHGSGQDGLLEPLRNQRIPEQHRDENDDRNNHD